MFIISSNSFISGSTSGSGVQAPVGGGGGARGGSGGQGGLVARGGSGDRVPMHLGERERDDLSMQP